MIDARFIESAVESGRSRSWPQLSTPQSKHLISIEVIVPAPRPKSLVCPDCCLSHPVEQTADGKFELVCEAGRRPIEPEALRQWRADPKALAKWMSIMLTGSNGVDERIPNVLWYLGDADVGGGPIPLWLARQCQKTETVDAIKGSLKRRSPVGPGIIITSSPSLEVVSWPRDSRTIRLSDLLVETNDGWMYSRKVLLAHAPAVLKPAGDPGAPRKNTFDNVAEFRNRVKVGLARRESLASEARALLDMQRELFLDENCHDRGSIENKIRKEYGAWKASGFTELPDGT